MRWITAFLSILILFLIQDGVIFVLTGGMYYANLVLVFLIIKIIYSDLKDVLIAAVISGLIFDFLSGLPDGALTLSVLMTSAAVYYIANNVISREPNIALSHGLTVLGTVIFFMFSWLVVQGMTLSGISPSLGINITLRSFAAELFLNALLTYPVFLYYNLVGNLNTKT